MKKEKKKKKTKDENSKKNQQLISQRGDSGGPTELKHSASRLIHLHGAHAILRGPTRKTADIIHDSLIFQVSFLCTSVFCLSRHRGEESSVSSFGQRSSGKVAVPYFDKSSCWGKSGFWQGCNEVPLLAQKSSHWFWPLSADVNNQVTINLTRNNCCLLPFMVYSKRHLKITLGRGKRRKESRAWTVLLLY